MPVSAGERYGSGAKGADGQSVTATGIAYGGGIAYQFESGGSLGLIYRNHSYSSKWVGSGLRAISQNGAVVSKRVSGVTVTDQFQAVTLEFSRGF